MHVWQFSQTEEAEWIEYYEQFLTTEELDKALRYRFDRDRMCSVLARGLLRTMLSAYLDEAPQELVISKGAKDKPRVVDEAGADRIFFNLSHSGDALLYAFSRTRRVGIDVEVIVGERVTDDLVWSCLTVEERELWHKIPADLRVSHFFRIWARKEAFMKGLGVGLGLEPAEFSVLLRANDPLSGFRDEEDRTSGPWWIVDVEVGTHAAAALAYEGQPAELSTYKASLRRRS